MSAAKDEILEDIARLRKGLKGVEKVTRDSLRSPFGHLSYKSVHGLVTKIDKHVEKIEEKVKAL